MYKLVLIRHGQSQWNLENRFTGWVDVDLSERGIKEAKEAAKSLKKEGYTFDIAFTSRLKRAIHTLNYVLDEMDLQWIDVYKTWRLNERHYGALQGLNKSETAAKYGEDQVLIWRRSYDILPPDLDEKDSNHPSLDTKYKNENSNELPSAESLESTAKRFLPYWKEVISKEIKKDKKVLIAAHGNSLRALVQYLDEIPNDDMKDVNIPTGVPLVYELDENLKPIKKYYIGDEEKVKKLMEEVANQGKAK